MGSCWRFSVAGEAARISRAGPTSSPEAEVTKIGTETALAHFRLVPPQPDPEPWILDRVALHSLRHSTEGWTWKFDPNLFTHTMVAMNDQLASVRCRVAVLRGEHSVVVPEDTAAYMYELMGRLSPVVTIPEAHHHLLLDQPLSFVSALRALLADWEHSVPVAKA